MSTGLKLAKIGWKALGMKLRLRDLGFDISPGGCSRRYRPQGNPEQKGITLCR